MSLTSKKRKPSCIVAIGGSAGALESFERFFRALPDDVEATFVVLQHMDPSQKSLLPELLGQISKLPVHQAKNGEALQVRQVYVLEPGTVLGVKSDVFESHNITDLEQRRHPIDHFFSSIASEYGRRAVGIVISGTGTDGTNGLRLIQEAGGRTLAQEPSESKFDGMPQSAIASGVVDRVMPIGEIAKALSSFIECSETAVSETEHFAELASVCEVLHRTTGHDFSSYKKSTVARRVERRVLATGSTGLKAYIDLLSKESSEPKALLRDLLISVTQFFRDPEVFTSLREQVVPRLFDQVHRGDTVRVWIPACATGEEAYSVAILLHEYQRAHGQKLAIQIFATDIDRAALEYARQGIYPASIAESILPEYLERYFKKTDSGYQASQSLREICIFSEHSLLKNPPFSKIDFISCRNLFIYWEPELQNRVLPLFHYALNSGGFLLLGPAENVAGTTELFRTLDKKSRIYQKLGALSRNHLFFPLSDLRFHHPIRSEVVQKPAQHGERDPGKAISSALLEDFAPPAFVVFEHGEIAFYSGKTWKYLEPQTGVPSNNIFDVIAKSLRAELHALLHRCIKSKEEVSRQKVPFERDELIQSVNLTVRPMGDFTEELRLYLVVLQEDAPSRSKEEALRDGMSLPDEAPLVRELEDQLRETREHLQSTIEEVRSSNEELLSMNEELQSANEELQTSKEELQSTNEELETVNSELSKKVEELDSTNSDLQNFFQGSQVPILFLDRENRVQKFTPAATRMFRLIPTDLGRRIEDIASQLEEVDFGQHFSEVLQTLQPLEKELRSKDQTSWFLMRVSPYRTVANVIAGVVVTFSDLTEVKRAQETKGMLAAIVESSADAIVARDLEGRVTAWQGGAEKLFQFTPKEAIGQPITLIIPPDKREEFKRLEKEVLEGKAVQGIDTERVRKDGVRIPVSKTMSPIHGPNGKILGLSVIYRDIADRKQNEEALKRSHKQLTDVLESMGDAFYVCDRDWKFITLNSQYEKLTKMSRKELLGNKLWDLFPHSVENNTLYWKEQNRTMVQRVPTSFVEYYEPYDIWTELEAYPSPENGITVFVRDITAWKKAEIQAAKANEQFRALADAMSNLAWIAKADGFIHWYNRRWYEYTGTTPEQMEGWGWQSVHDPKELPRVLEAWEKSIATGNPFDITFPLKGVDGQFRWFLTRANPLKDAKGKVEAWFGTNTDIDDQRMAREVVQQSEERLSFALAAASMGTFDWTVGTGKLVWSDQLAALHGLKLEEFRQSFEHARELTHPEDHVRTMKIIEESIRANSTFEAEYRVIWPKDKSIHWLYTYGRTIVDDNGNPVRSLGAVMDITERKRIENDLVKAIRTRDDFLSIASHELKTPLTSLKMQTQLRKRSLLKRDMSRFSLEGLTKMIEADERQVDRLTRLIDDMLDITRVNAGKLTISPECVDLCAVLNDVCDRFSGQLSLASCELTINCPASVMGEWDRFRIEQVLTNLLTNAMKYGPGKPIHIQISERDEKVFLSIQDHGPGIAEGDQKRIFNQFERAVDTNEVSGLGLGLYIVRQILEAHGGSISVESELGKGARFTVELPVRAKRARAK